MLFKLLSLFLSIYFLVLFPCVSQGFSDTLSLHEAIRMALERNPEIIASRKKLDAVRAQLTQARALPDPEFELEYEELPGSFSIGKFGERNIGFTQSIEFPVKWWLRNRVAGYRVNAVKFSVFEMTRLEVKTKVKIAYDRILLGKTILEYAKQNLGLAQGFLEKASVRFEAGDVSQLEVLRAEVEVGRAQNQVTIAHNKLSVPKAELNTFLARDIQSPLEVIGDLVFHPFEANLVNLKNIALLSRPDLQGSEMSYAESQTQRSAVLSSVVPDFNVGIFRQTINDPVVRESFWHVSFGLKIPLWAMFRQRGEIAEVSAEVGRAKAEKDALRSRILLEVHSAFLDLKAAEEQVSLFQDRTVRVAEQAYEMASQSYHEGKATYLEILDAQRVLNETRIEYAETLFKYRLGLTILERSIGKDIAE